MKLRFFTLLMASLFVAACSPSIEKIKTILNAHIAELEEGGSVLVTSVEQTEKNIFSGAYSIPKDSLTAFVYPFTAIIKKDQVVNFFKDTDDKNVKVITKKTSAGAQNNSNHYYIDATEMNNTIKFNVVRWSVNYSCSKLDQWFSEKAGLTTDNMSWTRGNTEQNGYFTFHRFNRDSYTCNFVRTSSTMGNDGYGDNTSFSKRDAPYSSLKRDGDYYVLDLREFTGYVPLYLPFSETHNKSVWRKGALVFEWVGEDSDLSIRDTDLLVETKLEYDERIKKEEEERIAAEKARKAAAARSSNGGTSSGMVSRGSSYIISKMRSPSHARINYYADAATMRRTFRDSFDYEYPSYLDAILYNVEAMNGFGGYNTESYVVFFKNGSPITWLSADSITKALWNSTVLPTLRYSGWQ